MTYQLYSKYTQLTNTRDKGAQLLISLTTHFSHVHTTLYHPNPAKTRLFCSQNPLHSIQLSQPHYQPHTPLHGVLGQHVLKGIAFKLILHITRTWGGAPHENSNLVPTNRKNEPKSNYSYLTYKRYSKYTQLTNTREKGAQPLISLTTHFFSCAQLYHPNPECT